MVIVTALPAQAATLNERTVSAVSTYTGTNAALATSKTAAINTATSTTNTTTNDATLTASKTTAKKAALNKTSLKLKKGKTYQLKTKNVKGTVTWKSSNKKIATVSKKGKVTAKKAGSTVIKATYKKNEKAANNYVKILSIRDTNIISLSEEKYKLGKQLLSGKTRDELYESTLIFGQTIHYIPDLKQMVKLPLSDTFSFKLYEGNNLKTLCDIEGFENSLAFDAEGNTNTTIVLCAIKDNEIIAIAGAAPTGKLMEVGIDVKKNWLPKQ